MMMITPTPASRIVSHQYSPYVATEDARLNHVRDKGFDKHSFIILPCKFACAWETRMVPTIPARRTTTPTITRASFRDLTSSGMASTDYHRFPGKKLPLVHGSLPFSRPHAWAATGSMIRAAIGRGGRTSRLRIPSRWS